MSSRSSAVFSAASALLFAAFGCNKTPAPSAESSPSASPVESGARGTPSDPKQAAGNPGESSGATGPAQSRYSESNFDLTLSPKGSYESGKAATVEIVLDAKDPFHVNDKYPYKFKVKDTPGVKYASDVVKDGVKLEKKRVTLPVAFTPDASGKKHVEGQFAFSVCTEEKCLVEKRDLGLDIDVK